MVHEPLLILGRGYAVSSRSEDQCYYHKRVIARDKMGNLGPSISYNTAELPPSEASLRQTSCSRSYVEEIDHLTT